MAQSTTGKQSPWDRIPDLPADHPLFKRGFVIGMRRSGGSAPQPDETPSPDPGEPEDSPNKGLRGSS
jgi:hypothetical protein